MGDANSSATGMFKVETNLVEMAGDKDKTKLVDKVQAVTPTEWISAKLALKTKPSTVN